ncbi:MAG: transglycosylase SLT domain-containing protein [Patescibacteria group bacterium]|nr:transglycosylase SLT domain-containing protein [Patescibacteria group bacterium]
MADYRGLAAADARRFGIDPSIFLRQIAQESGFNPNARSSAGAEGIAQFMPGTAAGYGIDPMNPVQALLAAAKMDSQNLGKYGSYARMLSAYNSGRPDAYKDPNFAGGQTYNYVRSILGGKGGGGVSNALQAVQALTGGSLGGGDQKLNQLLGAYLLQQGQQEIQSGDTSSGGLLGLALMRRAFSSAATNPATRSLASSSSTKMQPGTNAGGFLATGASYKPGRLDQGHDFQTDPGAPIVAPGSGVVVSVKSDPNGFGPAYPIVHFTSGPYAGKDIYIGHTISQLQPGQTFSAGQVISLTGRSPVGNAQVPGWAEIGFASGGLPGPDGQSTPF